MHFAIIHILKKIEKEGGGIYSGLWIGSRHAHKIVKGENIR